MVQCNRCNLQYRVSQKFVRLLYKSVTQYDWTWSAYNLNKSCDFQSNLIFHTSCAIFWLEIWLCNFAPRVRCTSKFSRHIFFLFCSPKCSNSLLVFVNILKDKPSQRKKHSATWEQKHVFLSTDLPVKEIRKKEMEKSECWVVGWSWRS